MAESRNGYEKPQVKIEEFAVESGIATSGGDNFGAPGASGSINYNPSQDVCEF